MGNTGQAMQEWTIPALPGPFYPYGSEFQLMII